MSDDVYYDQIQFETKNLLSIDNWKLVSTAAGWQIASGNASLALSVTEKPIPTLENGSLRILPTDNEPVVLRSTVFEVAGQDLDDELSFHCRIKSSTNISVNTKILKQGSLEVSEKFSVSEAQRWQIVRANTFPIAGTNQKTFFQIEIVFTGHQSQEMYLALPVVYFEYAFLENSFLREALRAMPLSLIEIDSEQKHPGNPMLRLLEIGSAWAGFSEKQRQSFRYLDAEERRLQNLPDSKSSLVDPLVADIEYLPWLAQFTGISLLGSRTATTAWGRLADNWLDLLKSDDVSDRDMEIKTIVRDSSGVVTATLQSSEAFGLAAGDRVFVHGTIDFNVSANDGGVALISVGTVTSVLTGLEEAVLVWEDPGPVASEELGYINFLEWEELESFSAATAGLFAYWRFQIENHYNGFKAGTVEAIRESAKFFLSGEKFCEVETHVPVEGADWEDRWNIAITTRPEETPEIVVTSVTEALLPFDPVLAGGFPEVDSVGVLSDGSFVLGGGFSSVDGVVVDGVAFLGSDGVLSEDLNFSEDLISVSLDAGFNPNANGGVDSVAVQSDGKILIGGDFTTVGGVTRNRIARLNADGTLDTGFNPNANANVRSIVVQSDGKILLGGGFSSVGGVARNRIARLNADGTLDTGFNPNASADVYSVVVQSDGKILLGGVFVSVGGVTRNRIARLNNNGTLDTGFNPNANLSVYSIAVQSDGKILLGGEFNSVGGVNRFGLARLNSDGTLDTGFNPNASSGVLSIVVQSDGKILIGGVFFDFGSFPRNRIARFNADGTLDTGFNPNANGSVFSVAVQSDGKILLGGEFTNVGGVTRNRIARVNADGTLDTGFNPNLNDFVDVISIQSDGKILIGGAFTTVDGVTRNKIARLTPVPGTLNGLETIFIDPNFNPDAGASVSNIAVQADGKILLGGFFTTVGGVTRNRIARVNVDGTLDTAFNPNANGGVTTIAVQSDGKILLGGQFTAIGGVTRARIARLNADGALDTGFNLGANNDVFSVAVQSDGKILLGGQFTAISGVTRNRIARLNADGTLDTGFSPNSSSFVRAIAVQADGKILLGGNFTAIGGVTRNRIARLNADGTLDTGFNPNASNIVRSIVVQSDGKILIGGEFDTIGGVLRNRMARVNADGTLDTGFDPTGFGFDPFDLNVSVFEIASIVVQPDGKILLGGNFSSIGGVTRNSLARVNADGTLDTGFIANTNSNVLSVVAEADGKILVGGVFTSIAGVARNRIARLDPEVLNATEEPRALSITVQTDNKTLIGGNFTHIRDTPRKNIARLNTDGDIDTTFDPNANNTVKTIKIQSNNKILVGGNFTAITGTTRNRIARIETDGTLDASFDPDANNNINAITIQPDNKILLGGDFTTIGGVARNRVARVNADGTLDAGFNPNVDSTVNAITLQADGKILLGGNFTTVGGVARGAVARINADGTLDTGFTPPVVPVGWAGYAPNIFSIVVQNDGKIIIAGFFNHIFNAEAHSIQRLNSDGTADTGFVRHVANTVKTLFPLSGKQMLVAGSLTSIDNTGRTGIALINTDKVTENVSPIVLDAVSITKPAGFIIDHSADVVEGFQIPQLIFMFPPIDFVPMDP